MDINTSSIWKYIFTGQLNYQMIAISISKANMKIDKDLKNTVYKYFDLLVIVYHL